MSKKSTSNKIRRTSRKASSVGPRPDQGRSLERPTSPNDSGPAELPPGIWWGAVLVSLLVFAWAYVPVFAGLVHQWNSVADYSHGYLVIPIAVYFLWASRDRVASPQRRLAWPGLVLILLAALVRTAGSYYYLESLQGWSIVPWLAGLVWLFFGWNYFLWALPAIGFLLFMVPLPYTVENMLGGPLQALSTTSSLFVLQCLGLPAVAEGNIIWLNEHRLEIERACSGLRIFMGMAALAYGMLVLYPRPPITQALILAAIVPITLVANTVRIVVTGLFFQMGWSDLANHLSHDLAGLFMIPFALLLFLLTLRYLDALLPQVESFEIGSLIEKQATSASSV